MGSNEQANTDKRARQDTGADVVLYQPCAGLYGFDAVVEAWGAAAVVRLTAGAE